jgi:hypothetical protein
MSMKNSNDTIWNRTRGLPACSAVPQPITPPAACPRMDEVQSKIVFTNGENKFLVAREVSCETARRHTPKTANFSSVFITDFDHYTQVASLLRFTVLKVGLNEKKEVLLKCMLALEQFSLKYVIEL